MVRAWSVAALIAPMLVTSAACSSSGSGAKSGPPSCADTSAQASRLARGCEKDGHVYKAIVTRCVDGRTMYNIPGAPPHGASGFTDGMLRTHAVTTTEVVRCQTGTTASP